MRQQLIKCPISGIAYFIYLEGDAILDEEELAISYTIRHPMSNVNTIKKNAVSFSSGKLSGIVASGAVITILKHHKLIALHDPEVVYLANQAISLSYTQKDINNLAYRLLVNFDSISAKNKKSPEFPDGAIPKFDLASVEPTAGECRYEEQYFSQCFKTWLRGILTPTQEDIIKEQGKLLRDSERKEIKDPLMVASSPECSEGSERSTANSYDDADLDMIVRESQDEAAKVSRRKSLEQVSTKVKGQLKQAANKDIISDRQYKILVSMINAQSIKDEVFNAVIVLFERYIVRHQRALFLGASGDVNAKMAAKKSILKVIESEAWFRALNIKLNSTNSDMFEVASVEQKDVEVVHVLDRHNDASNNSLADTKEGQEAARPTKKLSLMDIMKAKKLAAKGE